MKYKYSVLICKPELLENDLNNLGAMGWKLFHIQPLQKVTMPSVNALNPSVPNIEITYQLIFEKPITDA